MAKTRHGLSPSPGTYALFLCLDAARQLTVGRLGRFTFPDGIYAYAGSARGPGGLVARLERHLRHPKPIHWHVDALRAYAEPRRIWLVEGDTARECAWAAALAQMDGATRPIPGFGASDCRCPAHLIHFPALPARRAFEQIVGERISEVTLDE